MAEFRGHIITNNGRNLLSRALAGAGKIIFTKAAFGDQKYNDNFKEVTALKNKKLDLNVMGVRNDNGTAILTVFITNQDVSETFLTQEFGIFAKIEGDETDILFAYTTAIAADAIPNNNFGTTYESVNDIYLAFSNDIEADILVKDGVIFLTRDIADQVYTKNEYPAASLLSTSSNLKAEHLYADNNGNWYLNIGGERNWDRSPNPDENLIKLTFKTLYNFYKKIASLLANKEEKEIVTLKTNGIVGGTLNPSFIQDSGTKTQGQYYLDRNTGKLFQCIQTTSSIINSATFFKDVSLNGIVDRLENFSKFEEYVYNIPKLTFGRITKTAEWITLTIDSGQVFFYKDHTTVLVIPEGFRPKKPVYFSASYLNSNKSTTFRLDPNGDLVKTGSDDNLGAYYFSVTYSIN